MAEKFITIKKAAEILGVSPLTLRNWDKAGKFKAMRHPINNYRVYRSEDVNSLIEDTNLGRKRNHQSKKLQIKHLEE